MKEERRKWLILFNVSLGVFMATLDGGIVNIALPIISNNLKVNINTVQWVVSSYILTISALLLSFGRISDIYGRKKLYGAGYIIFTLGSLFCGVSGNISLLIISRVIQAIGASILMSNSQAITMEAFPKEERGKALGITGTFVALGSLAGPGLGGILVHLFGWESIFFINIPIGVIGFIMTNMVIPSSEGKTEQKFDYKSSVIFALGIVLLFTGLIGIQDKIASIGILGAIIVTAVLLIAGFLYMQTKAEYPLIDLELFKSTTFSFGLAAAFISFLAMFSVSILMPFYLETILKYSASFSGLLMMFQPAAMAIVAPVSGKMSDKIGFRKLTIAGLSINVIGLFLLSRLNLAVSYYEIGIFLTLLGIGTALFQSPNNSSVMGSVPKNHLGVAAGMNSLIRNLGMISGITFSVILFDYYNSRAIKTVSQSLIFINSMSKVFLIASVISIAGVVFTGIRKNEQYNK